MIRVAIINANTLAFKGLTRDLGGPAVKKIVEREECEVDFMKVLPNDKIVLATVMQRLTDGAYVDLVITTGAVGIGEGGYMPLIMKDLMDYEVPGVTEALRARSIPENKDLMLNRSMCAVRKKTLILNLPEDPKIVTDWMNYCVKEIIQAVNILKGEME